jgi:hypothetical protein
MNTIDERTNKRSDAMKKLFLFLVLAAVGVWAQTDTASMPVDSDYVNAKGGVERWLGEKAPHYSDNPIKNARKNIYVNDTLWVCMVVKHKTGRGMAPDTIMRQPIYIKTQKSDTLANGTPATVTYLRNISWCIGEKPAQCDTCAKYR